MFFIVELWFFPSGTLALVVELLLVTTISVTSILFFKNVPPVASLPFWVLLYAVTRLLLNQFSIPVAANQLLVELLFVIVIIGLTQYLSRGLRRFETGVTFLQTMQEQVPCMEEAAAIIHTEITRSRHYERPLSIILVKPQSWGDKTEPDPMMRQIVGSLVSGYRYAQLIKVIRQQLRLMDVLIEEQDGRLLILCPEIDDQESKIMGSRIENAVAAQLGSRVHCVTASFPAHGLTFNKLLSYAQEQLNGSHAHASAPDNTATGLMATDVAIGE